MTDINQLLITLREFLHTEDPNEEERARIFLKLQDNMEHQAIWLPMFQEHARWSTEPLVWSHVDGMDAGMLPSHVHGPKSFDLEEYAAVFPDAPLKILLRGGKKRHVDASKTPKGLAKRCVHLCIDRPEWSYDAGQDGQFSGSSSILDIMDGALYSLKGQLKELHTFTFEADEYVRYSSTDANPPRYDEQTYLLETDLLGRKRGFGRFKKLLANRHKLTRLTLSNKNKLAKYHSRTGKPKPHCAWMTKSSWWANLEYLDLHHNKLQDVDRSWLFKTPMPALVTLSLRGNRFTDEIVPSLTHEGIFPSLEHLDLRDNKISSEALKTLRSSPHLPQLKSVITSAPD